MGKKSKYHLPYILSEDFKKIKLSILALCYEFLLFSKKENQDE